jgi:hypothetical protein
MNSKQEELASLKAKLKNWESRFYAKFQRKCLIKDLSAYPKVLDVYNRFNELKKELKIGNGTDGKLMTESLFGCPTDSISTGKTNAETVCASNKSDAFEVIPPSPFKEKQTGLFKSFSTSNINKRSESSSNLMKRFIDVQDKENIKKVMVEKDVWKIKKLIGDDKLPEHKRWFKSKADEKRLGLIKKPASLVVPCSEQNSVKEIVEKDSAKNVECSAEPQSNILGEQRQTKSPIESPLDIAPFEMAVNEKTVSTAPFAVPRPNKFVNFKTLKKQSSFDVLPRKFSRYLSQNEIREFENLLGDCEDSLAKSCNVTISENEPIDSALNQSAESEIGTGYEIQTDVKNVEIIAKISEEKSEAADGNEENLAPSNLVPPTKSKKPTKTHSASCDTTLNKNYRAFKLKSKTKKPFQPFHRRTKKASSYTYNNLKSSADILEQTFCDEIADDCLVNSESNPIPISFLVPQEKIGAANQNFCTVAKRFHSNSGPLTVDLDAALKSLGYAEFRTGIRVVI